jgi:O-ureido-D-serine cyclo-ligase
MTDVLLATDAEHPDLTDDDAYLVEALRERGLRTTAAVWSDRSVDWADARIVVLRSVFDYIRNREAFCAWAGRVEGTTPIHNPARVVRWNSHKSYLAELERAGIAIVPTAWVEAGAGADLAAVLDGNGWSEVVVKPAVDNGARGSMFVRADERAAGQRHLEELLATRDAMIQPYMRAIEEPGEHKMIHIDGRLSHAIREFPRLGGKGFSMDRIELIEPHPAEVALAEQVLALVPEAPLLYARVDTVMDDGIARLMELEVIEPVLFFTKAPQAAERAADAIAARV